MKIISISDIIVPANRQRREFDEEQMLELVKSIETLGLLNPIVVRDGGVLVAGERRLKAITDIFALGGTVKFCSTPLPKNKIPVTDLGELSALDAEEAELDENIRRADLTWQERAEAVARLHALRQQQAILTGLVHSIADTAIEISARSDGSFRDNIRKNVIIAEYLDDPEVKKAKTLDEAFKTIKRKEEAERNVTLAATVGKTFSSADHKLYHADCLEWAQEQPGEQFDVILTDPPYGIDAHKFNNAGGKMEGITHQYDDSYDSWKKLIIPFAHEAFRLAKPQAHAYIFCDIDRFAALRTFMSEAGWWVHRTPIIRTYNEGARVPWPEHGPRRAWEMILYAVKGKKTTLSIQPDIISTTITEDTYGHGAQKPISLYSNLLARSTRPGDCVLDAFAGTGTIFPAAHSRKVRAVGVEMNAEYYGIALGRLGELR